jgi:hypothetical protein
MLRETLNDGADDHDDGSRHDAPAPTEPVVDPWRYWDSYDGSKLVARGDKAE